MNIMSSTINSTELTQNKTQNVVCDIPEISPLKQKFEWIARASLLSAVFFLPLATSFVYLSLFSAVIFFFLSGDIKRKASLFMQNPLSRMCVGLFLLFVIGSLYSQGTTEDIMEAFTKMAKPLYIPIFILLMREQIWRWRAMGILVICMCFSLIIGVIKWKFMLPLLYFRHASPATVFKSYIDTNLMMAFCVFILAQGLFLNIPKKLKYIMVCLMVPMVIYILWLSEGRAGYITLMVLWVLFCFQHFNFKKSFVALLGLSLLFGSAFMFSNTFKTRVYAIPNEIKLYYEGNASTSTGHRMQFIKNTFSLASERPLFGWGTGSFNKIYNEYARKNHLVETRNPHNEYLNIYFQLGSLGLIYLIAFFGVIFRISFKLPSFEKHIIRGALLSMILGCIANSWLMDSTSGYLFIMTFGLCAAAFPIKDSLDPSKLKKIKSSEISKDMINA